VKAHDSIVLPLTRVKSRLSYVESSMLNDCDRIAKELNNAPRQTFNVL